MLVFEMNSNVNQIGENFFKTYCTGDVLAVVVFFQLLSGCTYLAHSLVVCKLIVSMEVIDPTPAAYKFKDAVMNVVQVIFVLAPIFEIFVAKDTITVFVKRTLFHKMLFQNVRIGLLHPTGGAVNNGSANIQRDHILVHNLMMGQQFLGLLELLTRFADSTIVEKFAPDVSSVLD